MLGISAFAQTTFSNIPAYSPNVFFSGVEGVGQLGTVTGQQIFIINLTGVEALVLLNSGVGGVTTPQVWTLLDTSQY